MSQNASPLFFIVIHLSATGGFACFTGRYGTRTLTLPTHFSPANTINPSGNFLKIHLPMKHRDVSSHTKQKKEGYNNYKIDAFSIITGSFGLSSRPTLTFPITSTTSIPSMIFPNTGCCASR